MSATILQFPTRTGLAERAQANQTLTAVVPLWKSEGPKTRKEWEGQCFQVAMDRVFGRKPPDDSARRFAARLSARLEELRALTLDTNSQCMTKAAQVRYGLAECSTPESRPVA